ncbi:TIGR03016 family PEP-CTERM system-associated outer membrane protein [Noviherbaspirillum galbum]|uniref:TIGR03016 family PEP-CTERM system-associated outer membrane protein n=1 Tax=Noviherbaspirillum galbum TaxID=2709383 RepID=A0A6B3SXC3_9BURK|nr:TIGR03016 family PEP-CTERM system-associated outer membrane protein [Noviherbaspirillum galbum]NEX64185.1 TIGR03016 family PEP-CTERM system-associated outer membrane protein [Noviherbaspirillum galbum]
MDRTERPPLRLPRRRAPWLAAVLLALACDASQAADWTVSPGIGLRQSYSDNINLSTGPAAMHDWVTELIPRLDVAVEGARFKLRGQYALHYLRYHNESNPSQVQHTAVFDAHGDLVKDWLYLDSAVNVSQQRLSSFGPQFIDPVNLTANRTEVRTYSLSPYLRHEFDSTATSELRYTWQKTESSETRALDGQTDRLLASVSSGPRFGRWGWTLTADQEKIDYASADDVKLNRYTAQVKYAITPRVALNATAGYENNNYVYTGSSPSGRLWSVGASWTPSERSLLSASLGHRYFGSTYSLTAQHRSAHTAWNVTYNEDVSTQNATPRADAVETASFLNQLWAASIPDPAARQRIVNAFILANNLPATLSSNIFGLSNRVYLQRTWLASVAFEGARNTVLLQLTSQRRRPLDAGTPAGTGVTVLSDDVLQTGLSGTWSMRLSPLTSIDATAGLARISSFSNDRLDRIKTMRLGLSHQIGKRTTGLVEVRRQQRFSNVPDQDYTENALAFFVSMQF